ncbi:MAG: 16S rRNA (uracil(1498)-N(3))-methyltransferase [Ruminococcus sp.]|nr:16S rRNA (uracil(1498)-N(3))-methyltransferase [Ruminococcus sp.]
MPRFFCDDISEERISITGNDARHIGRSLRMRLGDEITVCSQGVEYISKILTISDEEVICEITNKKPSENEANISLTLFQAMPKADKLELIIQKSAELGVQRVCPVLTARCVSRPDKKAFDKKLERLRRIALEACKQSGRAKLVEITPLLSFEECIDKMQQTDKALMCYEKGGISMSDAGLSAGQSISLLIGSEGGFDDAEADLAKRSGITLIGLGKRILRCETAPIAASSIIMHLTGNM